MWSYISPHVGMHFEKGRRLNVGTLVSAEKVPESLDFCHHDLSADLFLMSTRVLAIFLRCWNAWDGTHQKTVDPSFKSACFIRSTWVMWRPPFRLESTDHLITSYRKIQRISPGAYIFQRPFLRGLYSEGLIYGMKFGFQNRLG